MPPAKKRGLSLEEKRDKLLEIFYESKDFYLVRDVASTRINASAICRNHAIGQHVQFHAISHHFQREMSLLKLCLCSPDARGDRASVSLQRTLSVV